MAESKYTMRHRNQLELKVLKTQDRSRQAAPPALAQFTPRALKRLTKQLPETRKGSRNGFVSD